MNYVLRRYKAAYHSEAWFVWQIRSVEAFGDGAVSRRPITKETRVKRKRKALEESIVNETNRPLTFFSRDRRAN